MFILLCFGAASAWGQQQGSPAQQQRNADAAPATIKACAAIAALANAGARALRAVDPLGHDAPIDLRNDGHPDRILKLDRGTWHTRYLADASRQDIRQCDDYVDIARWADDIAVVRVAARTWEVAYDPGKLNDTAELVAATDGTAMCRFHTLPQPPTFRLLAAGKRANAETDRVLLLGHGREPPSAGVDTDAAEAASVLPHEFHLHPLSWRVDLVNDGRPGTLVRVAFSSGAGRGCDRDMLGLLQNGRVTASGLLEIAPASKALDRFLSLSPLCDQVAETPVLDQRNRAYVLVDNTSKIPTQGNRVRFLAGARNGMMQPLARMSWPVRNHTDPP